MNSDVALVLNAVSESSSDVGINLPVVGGAGVAKGRSPKAVPFRIFSISEMTFGGILPMTESIGVTRAGISTKAGWRLVELVNTISSASVDVAVVSRGEVVAPV